MLKEAKAFPRGGEAANEPPVETANISGRITDQAGNGIRGIHVGGSVVGPDGASVIGPDGKPLMVIGPDGKPVIGPDGKPLLVRDFHTFTDSHGNYSVDGKLGREHSFTLKFTSRDGVYATEYYKEREKEGGPGDASVLTVPKYGHLTGLDATLPLGSSVRGIVVGPENANGGRHLRSSDSIQLCRLAFPCSESSTNSLASATSSLGYFEFQGLAPGLYTLRASDEFGFALDDAQIRLTPGSDVFFRIVLDDAMSRHDRLSSLADVSVAFNNLTDGASAITRGEFVRHLWLVAGQPSGAEAGSDQFSDVPKGHAADLAIGWARSEDLIFSCDPGDRVLAKELRTTSVPRFCIDSSISPANIAVVVRRFADMLQTNGAFIHNLYGVRPADLPADVETKYRVPLVPGRTLTGAPEAETSSYVAELNKWLEANGWVRRIMLPTPVQECNCDPVVPMFEYEVDDVSSVDRAAAAALFHSLLANPAQDPIPWPSVTNAVMVRPAAPAPEPEPAPEPAPTANATVTVKSGDSLSSIAQEHLGSSQRWNEIFELNKGKPQADGRSLTNQNLLRPGWVLELPS